MNKNKKAEMQMGIGLLFTVFIGVIVGLVLLQATATEHGKTTRTVDLVNGTYTAPATNAIIDLIGQELLNTPTVTNASSGLTVATTNYTIFEGVSTSTGLKTIQYKALGVPYNAKSVNISYNYGSDGYIEDSGAKAIAALILIFASLAIAVVALVPTLRSGVLDLMRR